MAVYYDKIRVHSDMLCRVPEPYVATGDESEWRSEAECAAEIRSAQPSAEPDNEDRPLPALADGLVWEPVAQWPELRSPLVGRHPCFHCVSATAWLDMPVRAMLRFFSLAAGTSVVSRGIVWSARPASRGAATTIYRKYYALGLQSPGALPTGAKSRDEIAAMM